MPTPRFLQIHTLHSYPAFPQCGCWVSTPARWQAVAEEVVGSWTR